LFCIPYAGGGPHVYRNLAGMLPQAVEVWGAQLPGRGRRVAEPPLKRLEHLRDGLTHDLAERLDLPFAFFGHSFGALLAFAMARALGANQPRQLFVSAAAAPRLSSRQRSLHTLPATELIAAVQQLAGGAPAVWADPEMRELLLPALRADLAVYETYRYEAGPPLRIPIVALGGRRDPRVNRAELAAWRDETSASLSLHLFAGGHFYFEEDIVPLVQTLCDVLRL
jgi:medium-chain acyl-[acyl-carrier-protein] hydrolase